MQLLHTIRASDLFSRITSGLALVLAASVGLLVAWWVPGKPPADAGGTMPSEESEADRDAGPPAVDLAAVVAFCARHTTAERGFVVFKNGTCVLVKEPSEDPVARAREVMRKCAEPDAKFLTERTREGDLIVTFRHTVFHWIPARDVAKADAWSLANLADLLSGAERETVAADWMPPADARIGLIGRTRLLADDAGGKIVKVLRPDTALADLAR